MSELRLISLADLIETEEHDAGESSRLAKKILLEKFWTVPIVIEINTNAIMDGHHRYNAAKTIGLSRIPCIKKDYASNEVTLLSWKQGIKVTVKDVFKKIKNKNKFPIKTTRHIFRPPINEINIPIDLLY
jgi:L-serine kinase (ADP)